MASFHIVWTIVLFALFLAIVWWAWSGDRKQRFDEAARLPLEEDPAGEEESRRRREARDG